MLGKPGLLILLSSSSMLPLRSGWLVGGTNKYKLDYDQHNKHFHLKPVNKSVAYAHKHLDLQFTTARRSRWQSRLPGQVQTGAPVRARRDGDEVSVQPEAMTSELGKEGSNVLKAQLCLCGVAVLWGTYSPVVRYIYACDGPPSPAALTAVRTVIQAFVLLASNVFIARQRLNSVATPTQRARSLRKSDSLNLKRNASGPPRPFRTSSTKLRKALNSTTDVLWIAGIELGLWNFCGSTFQALGLQYTSATRGAFLIQVRFIFDYNSALGIHCCSCAWLQITYLQNIQPLCSGSICTSLMTRVLAS